MTERKPPTITDVAKVAGVSYQTVSNVLNRPDIVREPTRERVRAAMDSLHYSPYSAARKLRTRRSATLAVRMDPYAGGTSGIVLDRFIHELTSAGAQRGLNTLLYAAGSASEEIARISQLAGSGEIGAVVLTSTYRDDPRPARARELGIPAVSFGRPWGHEDASAPPQRWVDVDGALGIRAATEHALAVAGPRVAFLGWPVGSDTGDDRERGWRGATVDVPGPAAPRLVAVESVPVARETVADALTRDAAFDALVCASDTLALGAHLAAVSLGREDLPIYGFDNTPVAEAIGLSSVEQRPDRAAQEVLRLITDPERPRHLLTGIVTSAHVLIEPELVLR